MNASKTLTSSVVAAALVGAIGFAYAQSSSTEGSASPQPNSATTPMESQNTQSAPTPSTTDSSTTPAPADTSSAPAPERAPQADRN
jgi:hypothetical protein